MTSEDTPVWLPPVTTVSLLTPRECAKILLRCQTMDMQPATRISDDDPDERVVDEDYRRAHTCKCLPGDPVYDLVQRRVLEKLPEINAQFQFDLYDDPEQLLPAIALNRYDSGEQPGHHGWHVDTGSHPLTQHRKLSIVVTLNPVGTHGGGDLSIHDGSIHLPLADMPEGTGAVFHGLTLHRVMPMLVGTRYSCVIWLMGPRFR